MLLGVAIAATGCSGDDATSPNPTATASAAGSEDTGECSSVHAHHLTMMWNPVMADEMTALGCPFPYEPYLATPTGAPASAEITTPYEVREYSELWNAIGAAGAGACGVAPLTDAAGPGGFTFGFNYALAEPGCASGPVAFLEVREYVSAGDRDAAAAASRDEHLGAVLVLGRWSMVLGSLGGDADAVVTRVSDALVAIGAQPLQG